VLLSLFLVLIAIGLIAVAAGSPATARRLSTDTESLSPLYFFYKQLAWVALGVPFMFVISMYPREQAKRIAMAAFASFLLLLLLVPILGKEVNGSQRWFGLGPASFQPSEFLKPLLCGDHGVDHQLAAARSDLAGADYHHGLYRADLRIVDVAA
jgi:cell division protein FtsW